MSAIIIGGNECMGRTYRDLCAKYNISARAIPLKKGSFANQLGKPDYIFVCMDTVSHPMVISAQKEARKHGARLVKLPRGSASEERGQREASAHRPREYRLSRPRRRSDPHRRHKRCRDLPFHASQFR